MLLHPPVKIFHYKSFPHSCKSRNWNGTLITEDVRDTWPGKTHMASMQSTFHNSTEKGYCVSFIKPGSAIQKSASPHHGSQSCTLQGASQGEGRLKTGKALPPALEEEEEWSRMSLASTWVATSLCSHSGRCCCSRSALEQSEELACFSRF